MTRGIEPKDDEDDDSQASFSLPSLPALICCPTVGTSGKSGSAPHKNGQLALDKNASTKRARNNNGNGDLETDMCLESHV